MSDLPLTYDAIIIGGGHNGLTAAAYLARARLKVLVLEARDEAGGMAGTTEIWPGYHVSRVAHVYTGLHPAIISDLRLHRHGLKLSARRMPTAAIGDDGEVVIFAPDKRHGRGAAMGLSPHDAVAFERFLRNMGVLSGLAATLGARPAGADADGERDIRQAMKRLDEDAATDFVQLAMGAPGELLRAMFETPLVQGALCVDGLLGGSGGPFDGGQMPAWAWRLAGEVSGTRMALGHPKGGMGAVSDALVAAIVEAGGTVQTGAKVRRVLTENGIAFGVETEEGLQLGARVIISNLAPRDTLLKLVGEDALEADTVQSLRRLAHKGYVARLTLALNGLPAFKGISDPAHLEGRLVIAPSLERLADAWSAAKKGEPTDHPAFEITIPTTHDRELAPGSKHILCANVLFTPYEASGGWDVRREPYLERLIDALNYYAPGIKDMVIHSELLLPTDLEVLYGSTGGHWHHAAMSFDHLLGLRFAAKAYSWGPMPQNLYFAGAGAHPGGGVTGLPGKLCAEAVIADMKS